MTDWQYIDEKLTDPIYIFDVCNKKDHPEVPVNFFQLTIWLRFDGLPGVFITEQNLKQIAWREEAEASVFINFWKPLWM